MTTSPDSQGQIELAEIHKAAREIERQLKRVAFAKRALLAIVILCGLLAAGIWLQYRDQYKELVEIAAAVAVFLFFAVLGWDTSGLRSELASLKSRASMLKVLTDLNHSGIVAQVGEAALSNVDAYFQVVRRKFRHGTVLTNCAAALSFLLICGALAYAFDKGPDSSSVSLVAGGAGILMQMLTGVFFVMNRADSQQLDKYQEKLERLTDIALMFGMINDLKNDGEALKMRVHVIGRIVDNRFGPASLFDKVTVAARTQATRPAVEAPKRQNA